MKSLELRRISTGGRTFGVLKFDNTPFAVTLELDDLENRPNISCIPAGEYICKRVNSPKFGDTFEVANVPGRTHILFAILDSKHGYNELMALMSHDDEFRLIIVNDYLTDLL